jgi:hypothetical protein
MFKTSQASLSLENEVLPVNTLVPCKKKTQLYDRGKKIKPSIWSIKLCQTVSCIIPLGFVLCNIFVPIFWGGKTVFHGRIHPTAILCPQCASRRVIHYGQIPRTFKILPVSHKKVELVVDIPRLLCKNCGAIRQPTLDFADTKKHYTYSLERLVIDLCRVMTLQDTAEMNDKRSPRSQLHRIRRLTLRGPCTPYCRLEYISAFIHKNNGFSRPAGFR